MPEPGPDEIRVALCDWGTADRRHGDPSAHPRQQPSSSVRCVVCCLDASPDYLARLTDSDRARQSRLSEPRSPRRPAAYPRFRRVVRRFRPARRALLRLLRRRHRRPAACRRCEDQDHHQPARRGTGHAAAGHPAARQPSLGQDCVRLGRDRGVRPGQRVTGAAPARGHSEWRRTASRGGPCPRSRSGEPIRFGTLGTVKPIKGHRPARRCVHEVHARAVASSSSSLA